METLQFEWEKDGKNGSFKVTASSLETCIEVAKKEIKKNNARLTDWYAV